jgi:hypothetical protein
MRYANHTSTTRSTQMDYDQLLQDVMTTDEVSETYGVDSSVIRRACEQKLLPCRKSGKRVWLIPRAEAAARWGAGDRRRKK